MSGKSDDFKKKSKETVESMLGNLNRNAVSGESLGESVFHEGMQCPHCDQVITHSGIVSAKIEKQLKAEFYAQYGATITKKEKKMVWLGAVFIVLAFTSIIGGSLTNWNWCFIPMFLIGLVGLFYAGYNANPGERLFRQYKSSYPL